MSGDVSRGTDGFTPSRPRRRPNGCGLCSKCGQPRDTTGRYCRACRSDYMRGWRAARKAEDEENRQMAETAWGTLGQDR